MSDAAEAPAPDSGAAEEDKKTAEEAGGTEVQGSQGAVPPPVDKLKRFLAQLVDGVIVVGFMIFGGMLTFGFQIFLGAGFVGTMVGSILGGLANLAGGAYILLRDSLNDGRSFGKKVMKLHVQTPDGSPCSQDQSLRRNAILGAPYVLLGVAGLVSWVPVAGWMLGGLLGLIGMVACLGGLFEALQVLAIDKDGRRLTERKAECYTVPE